MPNLKRKIQNELSLATGRYMCPPEFLSLLITFKCNFRCRSCTVWQKQNQTELSEGKWLMLADKLPQVFPSQTFVEINGGEPLMRYELVLDLIKNLKRNYQSVTLNSNGMLIDEKAVSDLESAGLDAIKISFYSLGEEIHDDLRAVNGAHAGAKKAMELIGKSKIKLEAGILITSQNISGVPALIEQLNQSGNASIILQPLDEKIESREAKDFKGNDLPRDLWPSPASVRELSDWISRGVNNIKNSPANIKAITEYYLDPQSVLKYRCFAGQRNAVIYPNGDLCLCFKGKPIGNASTSDIKDMLSNARAERKRISRCGKYCRIVGCNFSRGFKEMIG